MRGFERILNGPQKMQTLLRDWAFKKVGLSGTTSFRCYSSSTSVVLRGGCAVNKRRRRKMMRTRLLWFSFGLASTGAVFSHFIWKDLWVERHALASDVEQNFHSLEARISNLESTTSSSLPNNNHNPVSDQVEG